MTREQAEERIASHLMDIAHIVEEYGAPSGYLILTIFLNAGGLGNEQRVYISFNNEAYQDGADTERPLDYFRYIPLSEFHGTKVV